MIRGVAARHASSRKLGMLRVKGAQRDNQCDIRVGDRATRCPDSNPSREAALSPAAARCIYFGGKRLRVASAER